MAMVFPTKIQTKYQKIVLILKLHHNFFSYYFLFKPLKENLKKYFSLPRKAKNPIKESMVINNVKG
jgi:hypothetical protein